jgi:hypothetical protein
MAQISTNEKPVSFDMKSELTVISRSSTPVVTTPKLDMAKIAKEDKEDEEYDMPPRFGYSHIVNYDLNNSGTWYELPNGDKLWQLEVVCPAALSVNFCYDKFWIPEGGKFFVYSKDKKRTIGAFTSRNNNGGREDIRGFATGLVYGNDVVLEYYQPKEVTTDAIISIKYVVHGYRYIRIDGPGYGASDTCMVDINCGEGLNWQKEKKAVALIVVSGERWCTGSLINTTDFSHKPYLLTADHCLGGRANNYKKYDAVGSPNLDHFTFYWDYEKPNCNYSGAEPSFDKCTQGATVVANSYDNTENKSEFALFRLKDDPITSLSDYTPYYLGWDISGSSGSPGVCIHHPYGDVKKISTILSRPDSSSFSQHHFVLSYWKVYFDQGVVNHGSSGSPLLNAARRVIGQLRCQETEGCNFNGHALYGRFNLSWTGSNIHVDSIHRRLDCWLDSLNTGEQTMDGLLAIPSTIVKTTDQLIDSNIIITGTGKLAIRSNIVLQNNFRIIVESGGQLIIEDGGKLSNADLVLKPGAILEIKEGAILETRNGFEAPGGAKVIINKGKIM